MKFKLSKSQWEGIGKQAGWFEDRKEKQPKNKGTGYNENKETGVRTYYIAGKPVSEAEYNQEIKKKKEAQQNAVIKTASPFELPKTEVQPDGATVIRATPDRAKNLENIANWIFDNYPQRPHQIGLPVDKHRRRDHDLRGYAEQLLIIADELKRFKGKVDLAPRQPGSED